MSNSSATIIANLCGSVWHVATFKSLFGTARYFLVALFHPQILHFSATFFPQKDFPTAKICFNL